MNESRLKLLSLGALFAGILLVLKVRKELQKFKEVFNQEFRNSLGRSLENIEKAKDILNTEALNTNVKHKVEKVLPKRKKNSGKPSEKKNKKV